MEGVDAAGEEPGFEIAPTRPLARMLVHATTGRGKWAARRAPYAPSIPERPEERSEPPATPVLELCEVLLRGILTGEGDLRAVQHRLRADVVAWSPAFHVRTRAELVSAVHPVSAGADTVTELSIEPTRVDRLADHVYIEWRMTGRFTNDCFVDDDLLIEPTGRLVETAGILVATFAGDEVTALRCYFDDMAIIEQLLTIT